MSNEGHAIRSLTPLPQREAICEPGGKGVLRASLAAGRWLRRIVVNLGAHDYVVDAIEVDGTDLLAMPVSAAIFAEDSTIGPLVPHVFTGATELVVRVTNVSDATVTFRFTPYVQRPNPKETADDS